MSLARSATRSFTWGDGAGDGRIGKLYSGLGEYVTETRSGDDMRSGHAAALVVPVLTAGVGARQSGSWGLRLASFRLDQSELGNAALGVLTTPSPSSDALVGLLSGQTRPTYGYLRVLGHDMGTARGRAAVRGEVGVASRHARALPSVRIRRLVERAARESIQPPSDRHLLVAAILDRLSLTPWAEVPVRSAPELIARKARLAAACVHQPRLLLIDGLLDQLPELDTIVLADAIKSLGQDTAIIALGHDAQALSLICDQTVELSDGIVIADRSPDIAEPQPERPGPLPLAPASA